MPHKDNSKNTTKDKTITEIESELATLQKKLIQQTDNVKNLLKNAADTKQISRSTQPIDINLEAEIVKYTKEQAQADFFASIATLDTLILNYQQSRLDATTYNHQLKTILYDILKLKLILERKEAKIAEFIRKENIVNRFSSAYQKIKDMGILF
ncbi:MAG: hypothetical protein HWN66_12640 [Candidatus Helarchaeota archaeon]|nr:hypothetical protein [Candidatus Helarchaeota archaeon]